MHSQRTLYSMQKCRKKEVSCLLFCSCGCIAPQQNIVGQFIYTYTEAYLAPSQPSLMESFYENSKQLKTVYYFFKNAPSQIFGWVRKTPLIWMYLVIFRSVFSWYNVNILCVIVCQKIMQHKLLTFIVLQFK